MHKRGREARVASIYAKFIDTYPDAPEVPTVLIELGRTLRGMGAFQQAQVRFYAVLNSALAVSPENVAAYRAVAQLAKFEIAETFYQQGDYAAAGKYFGRIKLLDLPPAERARASFREAYAFFLDNKLEQTVTSLRTYLAGFPDDTSVQEGRYLLCVALRRLGRNQEALAETLTLLRAAQATAEEDRERWAYWQRKTGNQLANDFYEQGDFTAALTVYRTLAELRSDPAWRWPALYQVGLCFERLRQSGRAADSYRDILQAAAAAEKTGNKPAPADEEVRQMAEWRLGQLDWAVGLEKSVRNFAVPEPAKATSG